MKLISICVAAAVFAVGCDKKEDPKETPAAATTSATAPQPKESAAKAAPSTSAEPTAAASASAPAPAESAEPVAAVSADGGLTAEAVSSLPSQADYEAKAESEITKDNAAQELAKLDKDIGDAGKATK